MAASMYDSSIDAARVGFQEPGCDQQYLRYGHRDVDGWAESAVGVHAAFGYFEEVAGCDLRCRLWCCVSRLACTFVLAQARKRQGKRSGGLTRNRSVLHLILFSLACRSTIQTLPSSPHIENAPSSPNPAEQNNQQSVTNRRSESQSQSQPRIQVQISES